MVNVAAECVPGPATLGCGVPGVVPAVLERDLFHGLAAAAAEVLIVGGEAHGNEGSCVHVLRDAQEIP